MGSVMLYFIFAFVLYEKCACKGTKKTRHSKRSVPFFVFSLPEDPKGILQDRKFACILLHHNLLATNDVEALCGSGYALALQVVVCLSSLCIADALDTC